MVIIDEATQALVAVSLGLPGCLGSYLSIRFVGSPFSEAKKLILTSSYDTFS